MTGTGTGGWSALCEVEGQDVGRLMVRTGHAVDYRRYSGGRYERDQRQAREERAGIWRRER